MLLTLSVSAQRTIENPKYQSKGMGSLKLGVEKVVLTNDATKLYMNYYLRGSGGFNIGGKSCIVVNGKELQVLSAEGMELDGPYISDAGEDGKKHFVLNFPAIGSDVESIDFIEDKDNPRAFKIYGIALTDRASKNIKRGEPIPESLKNFAANVKDNGKDLEPNAFSSGDAIVKGRLYGYAPGVFNDLTPDDLVVKVSVYNPYTADSEDYSAKLNDDGTFEVRVPMTLKHQTAYVRIGYISRFTDVVLSVGKTTEVYWDLNQLFEPIESTDGYILAYVAGDNADLSYALTVRPFYGNTVYGDENNATALDYKQHVIDDYNRVNAKIDDLNITKRAKQFLKIYNKVSAAGSLSVSDYTLESLFRYYHNLSSEDPLPASYKPPVLDEKYFDFPKILGIDDIMSFYYIGFSTVIEFWNREVDKLFGPNNDAKRDAYVNEVFGKGDSFFKEFRILQAASQKLSSNIPLSDSELKAIDKMRYKEYGNYIGRINDDVRKKFEAEKARGGYYKHVAGESSQDSLFVEILKEFKGKVVFIDFWDTWCGPCRRGMKLIEPIKNEYVDKGVVFLYIADYSSPEEEYNTMITSINGKHHRLPHDKIGMLMSKFGFEAIPSYVIIGKDGMVKDFHTGFKGAEYYKAKFEEELKK